MRTKREDAPAKVRNFYKSAKSLIDMSNGEIKPGMLPMVLRMVGGISRAKEEDLEAVNNMTEEEWMEYMPCLSSSPAISAQKKKAPWHCQLLSTTRPSWTRLKNASSTLAQWISAYAGNSTASLSYNPSCWHIGKEVTNENN